MRRPVVRHAIVSLLLADEFAEFELPSSRPLTREAFRELCNKYKTKAALLRALSTRR